MSPTGATPGNSEAPFPGFDSLAQSGTWDAVTQKVVLARLSPTGHLRYFSDREAPTIGALLDRLLGQDDDGPHVSVLEIIDTRLADNVVDGYRYEKMPQDDEVWRRSAAGLDADAQTRGAEHFAALDREQQNEVIEAVRTCEDQWNDMPAQLLFGLWMRYGCGAFYSHPWAWNEIGFGGPAYPRGYKNIGINTREPWEQPRRVAGGGT